MTESETLAIVTGLVAAYPREMGETTLQVYVADLRDCEPEALMRAVVHLRRTAKWLPTIAEVRAALASDALRFPSTATAWDTAARLMARRGTYHPLPRGSSNPVHRALELCGRWDDICQEDMTWLRKRFVEVYDGLVREATASLATGEPPTWLEAPTARPALAGPARAVVDTLVAGIAADMAVEP